MAANITSSSITETGCNKGWLVVLPISPPEVPSYNLLVAIHCMFQAASSALNFLVARALVSLRKKNGPRCHTVALNLCLTDLIYNVTTELAYIILLILQLFGIVHCRLVTLIEVTGLFLCFASFLFLLFATVERYIAVFRPFQYESFFTSRFLPLAVFAIYLTSAAATAGLILSSFSYGAGIILLIFLSICGIVTASLFVRIFKLVYRVRGQMQMQSAEVAAAAVTTHGAENVSIRGKHRTWRNNSGYANLVAFLLVCMVACYLPYLIGVSLYVFATGDLVSKKLLHWLWTLMLVNVCLNPICFCYFDKEIRAEIKKTLRREPSRLEDSAVTSVHYIGRDARLENL